MRVLLVGHSHSGSINKAITKFADPALTRISAADFEYAQLKREPFHGLLLDSRSQLTNCGRALSERLAAADAAVLALEGNWHNAIGMVECRPGFDLFGDGDGAPPDAGRQIIPRSLLEQVFAQRMESAMKSTEGVLRAAFADILAFVREQAKCPCVLVEPPPPIPDQEKIARFRAVGPSTEHSVTPYAIRQKLWRLQCSLIRQYCDRAQVDYMPVPRGVFDAEGTLDPRAYEGVNDPTHMAPWYGKFVLQEIDGWLGRRGLERRAVDP
jgi:hypothetical protein